MMNVYYVRMLTQAYSATSDKSVKEKIRHLIHDEAQREGDADPIFCVKINAIKVKSRQGR